MRPNFRDIKDIPSVSLGFLFRHDLDIGCPGGVLASVNCFLEVACCVVRVRGLHVTSLFGRHIFNALIGLKVKFHVKYLTFLIHPLEGVTGVAVHKSVAVGRPSVAEEDGHLVDRLRHQTPEIPGYVWVFQIGAWIFLLGVHEVRKHHRVANEEDWGVIAHHVVVSFFCIELDSEATWIALSVS